MKLTHSIDSMPYGLSWDKWVQLWWKWCYPKPPERSPVSDNSGEFCSKGQIYDKVWFLAGTFVGIAKHNGAIKRRCKVPSGRSIFFPVINDIVSFATDPHLKTEDELLAYAKTDLDTTKFPSTQVHVDGIEIVDLKDCRVRTSLFEITLPPDSEGAYGYSWFKSDCPVSTSAISDGYWVFLRPLSRGIHSIEFFGEKLEYDRRVIGGVEHDVGVPIFRVNVKYSVIID